MGNSHAMMILLHSPSVSGSCSLLSRPLQWTAPREMQLQHVTPLPFLGVSVGAETVNTRRLLRFWICVHNNNKPRTLTRIPVEEYGNIGGIGEEHTNDGREQSTRPSVLCCASRPAWPTAMAMLRSAVSRSP